MPEIKQIVRMFIVLPSTRIEDHKELNDLLEGGWKIVSLSTAAHPLGIAVTVVFEGEVMD